MPLGTQAQPSGSGDEAGGLHRAAQHLGVLAEDADAVGLLDGETPQRPLAYDAAERLDPVGDQLLVVGEGEQRLAAALDVERQRRRRPAPRWRLPCDRVGGPTPAVARGGPRRTGWPGRSPPGRGRSASRGGRCRAGGCAAGRSRRPCRTGRRRVPRRSSRGGSDRSPRRRRAPCRRRRSRPAYVRSSPRRGSRRRGARAGSRRRRGRAWSGRARARAAGTSGRRRREERCAALPSTAAAGRRARGPARA